MKRTTAIAVAGVLLGCVASADSLQLKLEPRLREVRRHHPVVVRCLVLNPLEADRAWYLKRGFWLVPYSYPMDGDLGLTFQVYGPDGLLPGTTSRMLVARMKTYPGMFQPLYPGEIVGAEVDLRSRGLDYSFARPGVYRVSATLAAAGPREWLDRWKRGGNDTQQVGFKREELFAEAISAEAVEIQLLE